MKVTRKLLPAVFVGHGSPMNAIEDSGFSRAWEKLAASIPRPEVILCVSAHWETDGTWVTAMPSPRTIHDFSGFPEALYKKQYPAAGAPEWAQKVKALLSPATVGLDDKWGLDHGAWSVLCRMYPKADIPVLQLSLDTIQPASHHYKLGRQLASLREEGALIIGSGNIVHNLRLMEWTDQPFDWAVSFDKAVKELIVKRDHQALVHYETLGSEAALSIPTNEHYLPLLYILALQAEGEEAGFFAEGVTLGSISMRGVRVG